MKSLQHNNYVNFCELVLFMILKAHRHLKKLA